MAFLSFLKPVPLAALSKRWWFQGLFWGVIACCLVSAGFSYQLQDALQRMENTLLDMRLRLRAEGFEPSDDILILAYDQPTVDEARRHPAWGIGGTALPRRRVAELVDYLHQEGAKAVVLDVEFKEPTTEADDTALAAALQRAGNAYVAVSLDHPLATDPAFIANNPAGRRANRKTCLGPHYEQTLGANSPFLKLLKEQGLPWRYAKPLPLETEAQYTYCAAYSILPDILRHAKGVGITSVDYGGDGYLRAVPTLYKAYGNRFHTYLGIRPTLDLLGIRQVTYEPGGLTLDQRRVGLVRQREVLINWRNPQRLGAKLYQQAGQPPDYALRGIRPDIGNDALGGGHLYRKVSAIDVLRKVHPEMPASTTGFNTTKLLPHRPHSPDLRFKDKIVIYGDTIKDIHRTPMGNTTYGPEVLATVLDMFLHDRAFLQPMPDWVTYGLVALLCLVITWTVITFERLSWGVAAGLLVISLYWMGNFSLFSRYSLWFPLVVPTSLLIATLLGGTLYKYWIHDREKRELTQALSNYVAPQVMATIMKDPDSAMELLKGSKKELTVLFADIQGFTHTFENADPEAMVEQLNAYFDVMTEAILRHGGTFDKYMGDAIMAFFGAPQALPNHAEQACRAALDMLAAKEALNRQWIQQGKSPLEMGIGLSTGEMFVGNFGSRKIKDFTVMGSFVNLGARLESLTRATQAPIVISANTAQQVAGLAALRDLGRHPVKGFSDPVQVFALEGLQADATTAEERTA